MDGISTQANMPACDYDWLIVGAGFAGSILAERLAAHGQRVMIIDKRPHIAGNAYDRVDEAGLLIHEYGPHIFHTNSTMVFDYLSRFTEWRFYEHRVQGRVDAKLVPIPINLDTVNTLYDLKLTSDELPGWLAERAEPVADIKTAEDVVVSQVGRDLYEKIFRCYTRKQWGLDPSELDASVTARIPVRLDNEDRYFTDRHQSMPLHGYTKMFERMLDHPNITICTGTSYEDVVAKVPGARLIWTGPIDEFFGFSEGQLPYRSLRFVHETRDVEFVQPVGTVNYPQNEDYTRITEYKHLTGQTHDRTSIMYEYPAAEGEPYYPVPQAESQATYKRYQKLADATQDVWFVGRLATYRYYNMDQIVAQALTTFTRIEATLPVMSGLSPAEATGSVSNSVASDQTLVEA